MALDLPLRCRCGRVRAVALDVSPRTSNRLVCHCDDCQAFAQWLDRADVLDAWGGTDILQVPQARLRFSAGEDQIRTMRLTSRGLLRAYADCCRTPVGNTFGPRTPLVGLARAFVDPSIDARAFEEAVGAPVASIFGRFALGAPPAHVHPKIPPTLMLRTARLLATWALAGLASPSPFYDPRTKAPRVAPRVLSPEEREALRRRAGEWTRPTAA